MNGPHVRGILLVHLWTHRALKQAIVLDWFLFYFLFDNVDATIRIGREILCLLYAGFFLLMVRVFHRFKLVRQIYFQPIILFQNTFSCEIKWCILYWFLITNNLWNKVHTVHTLFMHEADPCSLQVYMVFHCVHFLYLRGTSGGSKNDLCVVFFTMLIICDLQGK